MFHLKDVLSHQPRAGRASNRSGATGSSRSKSKSKTKRECKNKSKSNSNSRRRAHPKESVSSAKDGARVSASANATVSRRRRRPTPNPPRNETIQTRTTMETRRAAAESTRIVSSRRLSYSPSSSKRKLIKTETRMPSNRRRANPRSAHSDSDSDPKSDAHSESKVFPPEATSIDARNVLPVPSNHGDTTDEDDIPYAMNFTQPTKPTATKRRRSGNSNDSSSDSSSDSDTSGRYDSPGAPPKSSDLAEPLRPGDVIEYQNTGIYTAGSHLGRNTATVLGTNAHPSCKFPLDLSSRELLATDVSVKRIGEWVGGHLYHHAGCYRPIRQFRIRTRVLRHPSEAATAAEGLRSAKPSAVRTRTRALDAIKAQLEAKAVEFLRGDHDPKGKDDSDGDWDGKEPSGSENKNHIPKHQQKVTMTAKVTKIEASKTTEQNREDSDSSDDSEVRKELERIRVEKQQQQQQQKEQQQTKHAILSPRTTAQTLAPQTGRTTMGGTKKKHAKLDAHFDSDSDSDSDAAATDEDVLCSRSKERRAARSTPLQLQLARDSNLNSNLPVSKHELQPTSDHDDYDTEEELREAKALNVQRKSNPHDNSRSSSTNWKATNKFLRKSLLQSSSKPTSASATLPPASLPGSGSSGQRKRTRSSIGITTVASKMGDAKRANRVWLETDDSDSDSDDDSLPGPIFAVTRNTTARSDPSGNENAIAKTTTTATVSINATMTTEAKNRAKSSLPMMGAAKPTIGAFLISKAAIADRSDNDDDNDDTRNKLNYDGDTSDSDDAESDHDSKGAAVTSTNHEPKRPTREIRLTPQHRQTKTDDNTKNETKNEDDKRPEWLRNLSRTAAELSHPSPNQNQPTKAAEVGKKDSPAVTTGAASGASATTRSLFIGHSASSRQHQRQHLQQEPRDQSFASSRRNDVDLFADSSSSSSSDGEDRCKGRNTYRKRNRRGELMLPSPNRDHRRNAADHPGENKTDKNKRAGAGLVLVKHNHVRQSRTSTPKTTHSKHSRGLSSSSPSLVDAKNTRIASRSQVGEYQPLRLSMGKSSPAPATTATIQDDNRNQECDNDSCQSPKIVRKRNQKRRERTESEEQYDHRRRKLERSREQTDDDDDDVDGNHCSKRRISSISETQAKQYYRRDRVGAHREEENHDNDRANRQTDEKRKQREQQGSRKNRQRPPPYPRQQSFVGDEKQDSLLCKEPHSTQENEWSTDCDSQLKDVERAEHRSQKRSKSYRDRSTFRQKAKNNVSPSTRKRHHHRQCKSSSSESESFSGKASSKGDPPKRTRQRGLESSLRSSKSEPQSTFESGHYRRKRVTGLATSPSNRTTTKSKNRKTSKFQERPIHGSSRRYQLSSSSSDERNTRSRKAKKDPPLTPWSTDCEIDSPPSSTVPRTTHRSSARDSYIQSSSRSRSRSRRNGSNEQPSRPLSGSSKGQGRLQYEPSVFEFLSQDENKDPIPTKNLGLTRQKKA
eukprot:jgi/Psemu1/66231/estExt_Genemark1.C_1890012